MKKKNCSSNEVCGGNRRENYGRTSCWIADRVYQGVPIKVINRFSGMLTGGMASEFLKKCI